MNSHELVSAQTFGRVRLDVFVRQRMTRWRFVRLCCQALSLERLLLHHKAAEQVREQVFVKTKHTTLHCTICKDVQHDGIYTTACSVHPHYTSLKLHTQCYSVHITPLKAHTRVSQQFPRLQGLPLHR